MWCLVWVQILLLGVLLELLKLRLRGRVWLHMLLRLWIVDGWIGHIREPILRRRRGGVRVL